ncbi:MAG TPA: hypothetical protein VJ824_17435 [Bacillota bacterium]|nr:hypothetical protein [Bacillota bacterium]
MAYAYYDKSGILHVVDHLGVAVDNCKGIVVETNIANEGGYPVVDGKQIIFDTNIGKSQCYGESGEKELMDTPDEIEELINKIFKNEYSLASENSSPLLP